LGSLRGRERKPLYSEIAYPAFRLLSQEPGGRIAREGGENMAISQVQLSTRISYETALRLDHMSKETGQSKAGIVEAALKAYLDAQKS